MKIGDLVKTRARSCLGIHRHGELLGFIVEIDHAIVKSGLPDYRTPTAVLVHFSEPQPVGELGEPRMQQWYHKSELELINEVRRQSCSDD
jgi:hypothetical protein